VISCPERLKNHEKIRININGIRISTELLFLLLQIRRLPRKEILFPVKLIPFFIFAYQFDIY
jgi:hypothetical protein